MENQRSEKYFRSESIQKFLSDFLFFFKVLLDKLYQFP